jgi:hypothetical protein
MTMAASGQTALTGWLADGTAFNQTVPLVLSSNSATQFNYALPVYVPLYGGKGNLLGWVFVSASGPGYQELSWLGSWGSSLLIDGWSSRYTPPTTGRVIALTNGIVIFYGLSNGWTNDIELTAKNQITNQSSNKLNLSLTLSNGLFSGSVQMPGTSGSLSFRGALSQDEVNGFAGAGYILGTSYFLGTNQSGQVLLEPTPQ